MKLKSQEIIDLFICFHYICPMNIFKNIFKKKTCENACASNNNFKIPDNFRIVKKTYANGDVKYDVEEFATKYYANDTDMVWKHRFYARSYEDAVNKIKESIEFRKSNQVVSEEIL